MRTVNLCLPGACMTVFVRPDTDVDRAVEQLAVRYEAVTNGATLSRRERVEARRRIVKARDEAFSLT